MDNPALIAELPRSPVEQAIPIPPADIRYRIVNQPLSEYDYIWVGIRARESIEQALRTAGAGIEDLKAVLDWGCGCSRIMRQWAPLFDSISFTGTDVDKAMITWDQANVAGPRFALNGAVPPLPCDADEFDLVYGASVFTHLDETRQRQWLAELRRVIKPGGILLLSTNGQSVFDANKHNLPSESAAEFHQDGFVFIHNIADRVLPAWYQTSFQTREHVERTFAPYFDVLDHVARGMASFQDLTICSKPAV
jgi:ubiquinone/menaquinone biosynthesis C-methylase UbiE